MVNSIHQYPIPLQHPLQHLHQHQKPAPAPAPAPVTIASKYYINAGGQDITNLDGEDWVSDST